jgi:hypothetical protein
MFIFISIYTFTIGQKINYEFSNNHVRGNFYNIIIQGFPIAILLTLFGTLKRENFKIKNFTIIISTLLIAILTFFAILNNIFLIGFGAWTTEKIVYRNKINQLEIKEQIFDNGAFGYGNKRIVKTKPFLKYWIYPTEIDTTKINKNEWIFVNEEGDIKFP